MSILDLFRLDGEVALVTGGTRGIGLGICQAFVDAGARLVVSSKVPKPEVIAELQKGGKPVDYIQADLQQVDAPARLIADALKLTGGRLDILVNNAGVAQHGDTETFTEEHFRKIMDINFESVFRLCQAALTPMRKQQKGVICNISSISGLLPMFPQPQAAYNASKAAVNLLTKSIASDYAKEGIRANAIAPGYIETDMTAGGFANPEWGPVWRDMTPLPKVGQPEDIGAAAVYLCSRASSYVTGEVLVVDGGYTSR